MSTVLMLLKTTGLEYDDRVRKEVATLTKMGHAVKIFTLEEANIVRKGELCGAEFESIQLRSVRHFPKSSGQVFKAMELFWRCLIATLASRPRTLWLHCHEFFYFVPVAVLLRSFGVIGAIVWDQHELPPPRWIRIGVARRAMSFWTARVDRLIVANQWRKGYLTKHLSLPEGFIFVLENRADAIFAGLAKGPLPEATRDWLDGARFFLAQGGAAPRRHFSTLVAALEKVPDAKLVVIGRTDRAEIEGLRRAHPWFDRRVCLLGMVPQMEITPYLDHSLASIVLYENLSANNWFCAPNRMFQAAARGVPLIVGNNPPMAAHARATRGGIVLGDDGSDVAGLASAMARAMEAEEALRLHAEQHRLSSLWEQQTETFASIMDELELQPLGAG